MKNTFYVVSLAALSLSSLKANYIEKAIKEGRPYAIKALVKSGFTYDEDTIKGYVELAEAKLEEKKEALDSVSFGHLVGPDLALAGISAVTLAATLKTEWNTIRNPKIVQSDSYLPDWNNLAILTLAVNGLLKSAFTLYKDVKKKDKKIEAVEKAVKVLRAVKSLKVTAPQIADH